jgi:hypothetical protein
MIAADVPPYIDTVFHHVFDNLFDYVGQFKPGRVRRAQLLDFARSVIWLMIVASFAYPLFQRATGSMRIPFDGTYMLFLFVILAAPGWFGYPRSLWLRRPNEYEAIALFLYLKEEYTRGTAQ